MKNLPLVVAFRMAELTSHTSDFSSESAWDYMKEVRDWCVIPSSIVFGFSLEGIVDADRSYDNYLVIPL